MTMPSVTVDPEKYLVTVHLDASSNCAVMTALEAAEFADSLLDKSWAMRLAERQDDRKTEAAAPRVATITKLKSGKIKLEFEGGFSDMEDLRRLNSELTDLRFIAGYPIGSNRFLSENADNAPAAIEILKSLNFEINIEEEK